MKISPKLIKILQISLMAVGGLAIALAIIFTVFHPIYRSNSVGVPEDYAVTDSYYGGVGMDESLVMPKESSLPDSDNYADSNTESKIQKSGTVEIKVEDLDESYDSVYEILQNYEGSLLSSYESGEGNDRTISMTLKIESSDFENVYSELKELDGEVIYASYYTDDVTMEYTDLESRLRNLESAETQLVSLLATAKTVTDTLDVYSELISIRSQIEVIEGQLKYFDNQVDYSYLSVYLTLSDTGRAVNDEAWKPLGVLKSAFSALVELGKFLVNALIWVLVFSPIVAIVVVIAIVVKRKKGKK